LTGNLTYKNKAEKGTKQKQNHKKIPTKQNKTKHVNKQTNMNKQT